MKNSKKAIVMPKKNTIIFEIIFIALISIALCYPYIFSDINSGHDGLFHMSRIYGVSEAFKDHQLIPRIYPTFNNNLGYGTPLFYCDLFVIPFAALYFIGFPLIACFKLMMIFYSTLSVFSIFYVTKKIFNNNKLAPFLATILYSFTNYHLIDLHVRMAFGEVLAIAFIPIVIYSMYLLFVEKKSNWIMIGISFPLLLFSHNLTFALYCILFGILIIFNIIDNRKNISEIKRILITVIKAALLGILISAWFLFPMIEQTQTQIFRFQEYGIQFKLEETYIDLLSIINPFNIAVIGKDGTRGLTVPGFLLTLLSLCLIFVKKNKYINMIAIISLALILCLVGIIPIHLIKAFGVLQFTFRLNIIIFPLLTFVAVYVLSNITNKKISAVAIALICIASLVSLISCIDTYYNNEITDNFNNQATAEELFDQSNYLDIGFNQSQLSMADYLPAGIDIDYLAYPKHLREMTGEYTYNEIIFDYEITTYGSKMTFSHNFKEDALLMFPKTYYKGYRAFIVNDGEWKELEVVNVPNYRLVGVNIPEGNHEILLQYSGTLIQKVSTLISGTTVIGLIIYQVIKRRKYAKV